MDLHDKIMNIQIDKNKIRDLLKELMMKSCGLLLEQRLTIMYENGHKVARHKVAELVANNIKE
jgi:hypothetical protein